MKAYSVVFSDKAKFSLQAIRAHLSLEAGAEVARHVTKTLASLAMGLSTNPRKHPVDQQFSHKNLTVRSLHKWSYKILYTVLEDEVLILRFFHTSQDPTRIHLD